MKRFFSLAIYLAGLLTIFNACQKAPINGHLDGRWQILEIEEKGESENVKDRQLYYNFYLHVCSLSFYGGNVTNGNMKYDGNDLFLDFPYITTPEGMTALRRYGINSNPVEFHVAYLDKNKLILKEGEDIVITLRKF